MFSRRSGLEDVVYLVWEARRYRRLKDHLLRSSARHGLLEILEPLIREIGENDPIRALYGAISAEALVKDWYANDEKAPSQVDALHRAFDAACAQSRS